MWLVHCFAAVQSPSYSTHSSTHTSSNSDLVGDRVLRETRDNREQNARLREIEDELARLMSSEVGKVQQVIIIIYCNFRYPR